MKRLYFLMLCLLAGITTAQAQIGYQISLLNTATGEPRANENITVTATITNSAGQMIYTTNQQARTNDFGVLSLSIGNAGTFENVDFTKLPFYIEVTANGVQIGKSQILTVPIAEAAKKLVPMDKNKIVGTWRGGEDFITTVITFNQSGTGRWTSSLGESTTSFDISWEIDGQNIYIYTPQELHILRLHNGALYCDSSYGILHR